MIAVFYQRSAAFLAMVAVVPWATVSLALHPAPNAVTKTMPTVVAAADQTGGAVAVPGDRKASGSKERAGLDRAVALPGTSILEATARPYLTLLQYASQTCGGSHPSCASLCRFLI